MTSRKARFFHRSGFLSSSYLYFAIRSFALSEAASFMKSLLHLRCYIILFSITIFCVKCFLHSNNCHQSTSEVNSLKHILQTATWNSCSFQSGLNPRNNVLSGNIRYDQWKKFRFPRRKQEIFNTCSYSIISLNGLTYISLGLDGKFHRRLFSWCL